MEGEAFVWVAQPGAVVLSKELQPLRSSPRIANKPCKIDGYPLAVQRSVTKCRHRLQCAAKPRPGGAVEGGGEVNKAVTSAVQTTLLLREQGASVAILFPLSPSRPIAMPSRRV